MDALVGRDELSLAVGNPKLTIFSWFEIIGEPMSVDRRGILTPYWSGPLGSDSFRRRI